MTQQTVPDRSPDGSPDHSPDHTHPGATQSPAGPRTPSTTSRFLLSLGILLAALMVAWAALFFVDRAMLKTTTTHESYGAVGTVEFVADGHVTVRAAAGDVEVDRIAHSGLTKPAYDVEESGDRLTVTHRCTRWVWAAGRCAGELDVTLPAETQVLVRTSNGEVVATGIAGDVELGSSNGSIEAIEIGGALRADSSNGDVVVSGSGSEVDVRSSNGTLEVSGVDGTLTADTSNGEIEVDDVTGSARATTSNGKIEVAGVGGNVFAESSNGEVTVRGDGEPVALTIDTSNGEQTIEGPTDPDAARTVEIRSSNGNVSYLAP
jgi:DUF4097 and DUF4098 domain-containing protein YvlB